MKNKRQIVYFRQYFKDFYDAQTARVKTKIDYVLYLITVAELIPKKFFKPIIGTEGLYEIRIEFENNIFRIFCCLDEGNLVVLFNSFQKKSQKTPKREIEKALRIKSEYFEYKKTGYKR